MRTTPPAKRARAPALDAAVSTVAAPGLGEPRGLFVLADGTILACAGHSIRVLAPSGLPVRPRREQHETRQPGRAGRRRAIQPSHGHHGGPGRQRGGGGLGQPRPAPRVQGRRGQHPRGRRGGGLCRRAGRGRALIGLAVDVDGSILVTDRGNHAVRRVTIVAARVCRRGGCRRALQWPQGRGGGQGGHDRSGGQRQ